VYFVFLLIWFAQYAELEGCLHQMEFDLESVRGELQMKLRQLSDTVNNVNDLKQELAGVREQLGSSEKEVCIIFI
jgi:phage-related minor tail protein